MFTLTSDQQTEIGFNVRPVRRFKPLTIAALLGLMVLALTGNTSVSGSSLTTYTSVGTGTNPDGTTFRFATGGGAYYTEMPDRSGSPGTSGNFTISPDPSAPGGMGVYSAYQSVQVDMTGTSPSANGFSGTGKWGNVRATNGSLSADVFIGAFTMNPIVPGFNKTIYASFPKFSSYYHTVGPSVYFTMTQSGTSNTASAGSTNVW